MRIPVAATAVWITTLASLVSVGHGVPDGFGERLIFKNGFMTDLAFTTDNRMFVTQKEGFVHIYEPGDDYQYGGGDTTVLDIAEKVCIENERGLGGLQLHPNFDSNGWIYLYYTFPKNGNCDEDANDGPVNRLSRWTWNAALNEIDQDSEVVLLDTPSTARAQHNSGKIEFGKDGMLYLTIGDTGVGDEGQNLNSVLGGMIRLTDTGDIPSDNPFAQDPDGVRCNVTGRGDGKCQELYAVGLRNAWRFAMNPNTEGNKIHFYVNDVGADAWEETSEGGDDFEDATLFNYELGIQNFGWPVREGPCKRGEVGGCDDYEGFIHPIHYYQHEGGGACTGGAFVPNGVWGTEWDDKYLYGEFVFGQIYSFGVGEGTDCAECNPANSGKDPQIFTTYESILTMRFGPYINGQTALYYTSSANGGVMMQVYCENCPAPGTNGTIASPTIAPTAAPTVYVPPVRPDGEGGYPGVLFPWSSSADCPEGYDYCGVLEFCMGESNSETGPVYGYRLPCPEGETCECNSIPGPLIRLIPGNVYKLTLRNAGTEVTNLHTHGLHIVGDGDGDDVVREVNGGNCLDYTWDIKSDHPGGTSWYHAHLHTISEKQVGGGAFGMLIVEENPNLDSVLPSWAGNELLLQVSVSVYTDEMYANGRQNEVIDIAANQWYRLRVSLVNANAIPYNFTFADQGMCEIHKVAQDGIWRSTVPGPMKSSWELTGASRADFAIKCNTPNALVPLLYRNEDPIANIWVGPEEDNLYTMEEWQPTRPYSISDMTGETVPETNKFAVSLGFDYVNDQYWDPMVPIETIAYDQVHEWTLQQTWFHPFHVHLYHMQVVTPGGCGDGHEEGEFYDTISANGNCTVRFRTADIGQRCVLHCHVLFHEDSGSMSWVNVTGEGMPMNLVQSPEYVCPSGTLPTRAPTAPTIAPTSAPTYSNSCVPGYLGIATGQPPLLDNEPFANPEFGVFIIQQGDGNLIVKRGTPDNANATEIIWASGGGLDNEVDFFSQITSEGTLETYAGTPDAPGQLIYSTGSQVPSRAATVGDFFLGIDCNSEVVSVYSGTWENPREGVSVWNSQPTVPPTAYPTRPPTTAPPTVAPEPTQQPVKITLTAGPTLNGTSSTSSASVPSMCLSVVFTLLLCIGGL